MLFSDNSTRHRIITNNTLNTNHKLLFLVATGCRQNWFFLLFNHSYFDSIKSNTNYIGYLIDYSAQQLYSLYIINIGTMYLNNALIFCHFKEIRLSIINYEYYNYYNDYKSPFASHFRNLRTSETIFAVWVSPVINYINM